MESIKHPNFFLIGVVKGGTTSLHHYLDQHPEVYMSPVKETNYFAREDIDSNLFASDYAHDVNVNLSRFFQEGMKHKIHIAHIQEEAEYLRLFENATDEKILGEASASYILYPNVPRLIHERYPNAKILMILRNPADRAFSQYIMNLRLGKTLEKDFLKEIQNDASLPVQGWGANHQYLMIGEYYKQVKRYFDYFSKEQVMICWYEDYRDDPEKVLKEIYRFLGIREDIVADTSKKLNTAGVPRFAKLNYWINQMGVISWAKRSLPHSWRGPFKKWLYSKGKDAIPKMTKEERKWLINYYEKDIRQLEKITGKDLDHWLKC